MSNFNVKLYRILLLATLWLMAIVVTAQVSDKALLQDINIQIVTAHEIRVQLTFLPNALVNQNKNILGLNNQLFKDLPSSSNNLPVPSINKENNILKMAFNNSYAKLDNNMINVNHELLRDIKSSQLNSKLELLFDTKPGSFYTIKQEGKSYIISIMAENVSTAKKDKTVNDFIKEIADIKKESQDLSDPKNLVANQENSDENILPSSATPAPLEPILQAKKIQPGEELVNKVIAPKDLNQNAVIDIVNKYPIQIVKEEAKQIVNAGNPEVQKLDFSLTEEKAGKIIINFNSSKVAMKIDDSKNQQKQLIMQFKNIRLPAAVDKSYDVTDFGSVVKQLDWERSSKGDTINLVITSNAAVDYVAYQLNNQLIVEVKDRLDKNAQDFMLKKEYNGKKISLNFQSIELRSVLQLIADFTDLNLVASDTVAGNISLRLMNVPWDQALDIVLKTKNLDKRHYGNILMIAPASELFELERAELETSRTVEKLVNLETEYFHVNYAKAEDIAGLINSGNKGSILSDRGKASFDKRTNILIVQDTPTKLKEINNVLKKLDSPVKQVLIEARLVKADTFLTKELGVRWGLSNKRSSDGFKLGIADTSYNATQNARLAHGGSVVGPKSADEVDATLGDTGYNIDLGVTNPTGIIGLALAKLPGKTLVSLELSALETEGLIETISSPKIITANKVPAKIEQGQEIPYREATSSGAASISFKKAVLSLTVTPQITPDNNIIMDLKVTNNTRNLSGATAADGAPIIDTQEMETQVLVDNSQTIVLGGIFTQNLTNSVERVPFFGELPLVGQLFRKNVTNDRRSEFLIFLTPKIVVENT